ncbi:hypothetical protein I316_05292 [Kwoniella heveanensis BCC8398]|uniref:HMG box domain-containing protein n=1 Tax=Kwoniella heveanensis BCC8398 TaxID=1296120 RepID=A0A1B9GPB6_9TREE|nr:hypothetical protein I316_05292 [Kwoniella heveanensis BCC8398]
MLSLIRPGLNAPAALSKGVLRGFSSSAFLSKKKAVDPTLPVPPKGPASAYTLFFKQYVTNPSNSIRKPDGKLDMPALAQAAGKAWSEIPSSDKSSYESEASSLRKSYEAEYKSFYQSTSPETRQAIYEATGKEVKPPGGKKGYLKSIAERAGNPGKPLTPYFAFAKEQRDNDTIPTPSGLNNQEKLLHQAKETGKLWKELSEAEKQKYKDAYGEAKAKWDAWAKTQSDL